MSPLAAIRVEDGSDTPGPICRFIGSFPSRKIRSKLRSSHSMHLQAVKKVLHVHWEMNLNSKYLQHKVTEKKSMVVMYFDRGLDVRDIH